MRVTGMLYGSKLLQFAGFPPAEVLGPDASEEDIKAFSPVLSRAGESSVRGRRLAQRLLVNIDAVIAALLLKILWKPYRDGAFS